MAASSAQRTRARAPSRKALEALGLAEKEGAQLMSKDKREEQCRLNRELKKRRRAAEAAATAAGEEEAGENVREASDEWPMSDVSCSGDCGKSANCSGPGTGNSDRDKAPRKRLRKSTLAEALQPAVEQLAAEEPGDLRTDGASVGAMGDAAASKKVRNPSGKTRKSAESEDKNTSERKDVGVIDGGTTRNGKQDGKSHVRKEGGKVANQAKHKKTGRRTHKEDAVVAEGANGAAQSPAVSKATCVFKSCFKTATFGVNGAVRYW